MPIGARLVRKQHRTQFGFLMPGKALVIAVASVELIARADSRPEEPERAPRSEGGPEVLAQVESFMEGQHRTTPVYDRESLLPLDKVDGPAIIRDPVSTIVVEPGWQASITRPESPDHGPRHGPAQAIGDGHAGGPRDAGGLQQPVHVGGGANGRHPAEGGLQRQHQGTPGFLLRCFRPGYPTGGQRAPCAGAPGIHGRERAGDCEKAPGQHAARAIFSCSTTPTTAALTYPISPW